LSKQEETAVDVNSPRNSESEYLSTAKWAEKNTP